MIMKTTESEFKNARIDLTLHDDEHEFRPYTGRPSSVGMRIGKTGCDLWYYMDAMEFHRFAAMVKSMERFICKAERRIANAHV